MRKLDRLARRHQLLNRRPHAATPHLLELRPVLAAQDLVSGALITPEPKASQPGWDCRLWRGDGYCLLTAAHLAGLRDGYPALDPAPISAPVVVMLPSANSDAILPTLDRWAELIRRVG